MNKRFPYKSILIACSVNTARSCMAEGFFREIFAKNNLDIKVFSGGIASNARDGMLISMDAKLAMNEIGIKLSETSTSIDLKKHKNILKKADLILTMTEQHKNEILMFEEVNNTPILTLKEFAGSSGDIVDPSMKELEGFRETRDEIMECLIEGLEKYYLKFEWDKM